jgi:hypothetical protein
MDKDDLILQRPLTSRPSGEWNEEDFDALVDGDIVGRIFKVNAAPIGTRAVDVGDSFLAPRRRARPPWQHSRKAGGESE